MSEKKENLQIVPTNEIVFPNDMLSRGIFGFSELKLLPTDEKDIFTFLENQKPKIETKVFFKPLKGDLEPFDYGVLSLALSEIATGNEIFTVRRLWQKVGGGYNLPVEMEKRFLNSIERLSLTKLGINMSEINKKFKYSDKAEILIQNYLLPCKSLTVKINGQTTTAFKILDTPPLLEIAELKWQIAKCDSSLLNIPKLKNTEKILILKIYLTERIISTKNSYDKHKAHFIGKNKEGKPIYKRAKQQHKIILFSSVYRVCGMNEPTKRQQQQTRETITKILEHFKAKGLIKTFDFTTEKCKFYSITFDW